MTQNKQSVYSVLLMRDDSRVKAFRMHSFWFKAMIIFVLLMVILSAFGVYGTFYYKKRYVTAAADRNELQSALNENKILLQRLTNLEKLINTSESVKLASINSVVDSSLAVNDPATSPESQQSTAPSPDDLKRLLGQAGPISTGVSEAVPVLMDMESHPVKVRNLKTEFDADEHKIRIVFDLSNQEPTLILIGRCNLSLITKAGATIEVSPVVRGAMSFQIARFRKMESMFSVPAGISQDDIVEVIVSVQANELPIYKKAFPIGN